MTKLRNPKHLYYDLDIPEISKTIKYRAMKVGEAKAILTAVEMKDPKAVINSIVDIVRGVTDDSIDITKTPQHIVDFVFLKSYIKASGARPKVEYTCGGSIESVETHEDGTEEVKSTPCDAKMILEVNLDNVNIKYPENYQSSRLVKIDDQMSIKLRIPDFETFKGLDLGADIYALTDQFIYSGVEYIMDGEDMIIPGQDFSIEDLSNWMNELDQTSLNTITEFFQDIPKIYLKVPVTCPKCGKKEDFEFTQLEDFFL